MKIQPLRNRGFTLVEILVVIAILTILAALIFASGKKAISSAESANCVSNMRQIPTAHTTLAQEYNGYIVNAWRSEIQGSWARNWAQYHTILAEDDLTWRAQGAEVDKKIRNLDYLQCPTAFKEQRRNMSDITTHDGWRTYSINHRIGKLGDESDPDFDWIDGAHTISEVEQPEKLIFVVERAWNGSKYPGGCGPYSANKPDGFFSSHGGKTHIAYFDGHVERKKPEEVPYVGATLANGEKVPGLNKTETSLIWRGISYAR